MKLQLLADAANEAVIISPYQVPRQIIEFQDVEG